MRFKHLLQRMKMSCTRPWKGARNRESGQALVETAFAVLLLTPVLIGGAELARVAYAAIEVANAARAGVQYGTQNGFAASDTTGIQTAAANDASNLTGFSSTS